MEAMADVALQSTFYAKRCYELEQHFDYPTMSPYIPLALYQSALIFQRLSQVRTEPSDIEHIAEVKQILRHFAKRWAVSGELHKINRLKSGLKLLGSYLTLLETPDPPLLPRLPSKS